MRRSCWNEARDADDVEPRSSPPPERAEDTEGKAAAVRLVGLEVGRRSYGVLEMSSSPAAVSRVSGEASEWWLARSRLRLKSESSLGACGLGTPSSRAWPEKEREDGSGRRRRGEALMEDFSARQGPVGRCAPCALTSRSHEPSRSLGARKHVRGAINTRDLRGRAGGQGLLPSLRCPVVVNAHLC